MNISISPKKKKNEILQLSSTRFHILKPLHDRFIINPASYIFFNVRSQTIIQNTLTPHIHTMIHSCISKHYKHTLTVKERAEKPNQAAAERRPSGGGAATD